MVSSALRLVGVLRAEEEVKGIRVVRLIQGATVLLSLGYLALFLGLAYLRLVYPYEVEWMEGAMMDHAVRILHGQPIYTVPTIDFAAWLYPPLYYYVVAGAMKLFGAGWFAGRLVSILSTFATGAILYDLTYRSARSRYLAFLSVVLYIASYHATGFYFDIVRNDAFFVLTLTLTTFCVIRATGPAGAAAAAVLLVLSFLTKQQAIFYLPAFGLWYWLRDRKSAVVFVAAFTVITLALYLWADHQTNGWFFYYLFKIPGAKRVELSWIRALSVFPDFVLGSFTMLTIAGCGLVLFSNDRIALWKSESGLLLLLTLASIAAGAMSLGNEGGYKNVMLPFAACAAPLLPIAVSRLQGSLAAGHAAILFQLIAFFYNPLSEPMLIASSNQRSGGDEFMRQLGALPGDVYIPYHSYVATQAGKASHAHILATIDVLRMHDSTARRLQSDYDSAYAQHRFAGIIMEESRIFRTDSVTHYTLARGMVNRPNVNLTRVADGVTRPQWLFVPAP